MAATEFRPYLAALCVCFLGAAAASTPWSAAHAAEDGPTTVPDLLVPKKNQNLGAYRFDGDVFGWNKSFTEVAAVGSEVTRGERGNQRGEAFLLVYPVGDTQPIKNINCHVITHADMPDDPVPIEDVRDMMWVLENPLWLEMWPIRPHHTRPKGAMQVQAMWDPMDANTTAHTAAAVDASETAPVRASSALCTPGVGFILTYRGQRRVQPHVALDIKARCNALRLTDNRLYWAGAQIVADMVRFDFSPNPDNEESARFVVSAAWRLAEPVHFEAQTRGAMPPALRAAVQRATQAFGPVRFSTQPGPQGRTHQLTNVVASPRFLALGRRIAQELGAPPTSVVGDTAAQSTLSLIFAAAPPAAATPAAATTSAAAITPAAATPKPVAPNLRGSSRDAGNANTATPSPYLKDWHVPP